MKTITKSPFPDGFSIVNDRFQPIPSPCPMVRAPLRGVPALVAFLGRLDLEGLRQSRGVRGDGTPWSYGIMIYDLSEYLYVYIYIYVYAISYVYIYVYIYIYIYIVYHNIHIYIYIKYYYKQIVLYRGTVVQSVP